jgi:Fe-S-cluster containining protein
MKRDHAHAHAHAQEAGHEEGPGGGVRDGAIKGLLKRALRAVYLWELGTRRRLLRARGQERYVLSGSCESCAKCCEEPTLLAHPWVVRFTLLRWLFLTWQRRVNGFVFTRQEPESDAFVFSCSHFDASTRRCDSYATRPGICWDYPRYQLDQPWPELFDECGYRALAKNAHSLASAIDQTPLSPDERERLKRKLHVLK